LLQAGLSGHFSGHLHVEGVTRRGEGDRSLTNIAVPSLVAFPPAFKVVHPSHETITIETVEMSALPVNSRICAGYAQEAALTGEGQDTAFTAGNYGVFLRGHQCALVRHRYFIKEWPAGIVTAVKDQRVVDVLRSCSRKAGLPSADALSSDLSMSELIADWYCLRQGAALALPHIEPERLMLYRMLAERFGREPKHHDGSLESFLGIFFGALGLFLDRAECGSRRVTVELATRHELLAV
jgi:hypothetical protein